VRNGPDRAEPWRSGRLRPREPFRRLYASREWARRAGASLPCLGHAVQSEVAGLPAARRTDRGGGLCLLGHVRAVEVEVASRRPFRSVAIRPSSRASSRTSAADALHSGCVSLGSLPWNSTARTMRCTCLPTRPRLTLRRPPIRVCFTSARRSQTRKDPAPERPDSLRRGRAVVHTAIQGRGLTGIRILGRGIIDTSGLSAAKAEDASASGTAVM